MPVDRMNAMLHHTAVAVARWGRAAERDQPGRDQLAERYQGNKPACLPFEANKVLGALGSVKELFMETPA